jgi:hypothetical protein
MSDIYTLLLENPLKRFAPLFKSGMTYKTVEERDSVRKAKKKITNEIYYDAHVAVRKIYDAQRYIKKQALKFGRTQSDFCLPYNIQMDKPCLTQVKKKKMTLLMRKNKKIQNDLAALAAKADAFRAKLEAGLVVDIAEHLFN